MGTEKLDYWSLILSFPDSWLSYQICLYLANEGLPMIKAQWLLSSVETNLSQVFSSTCIPARTASSASLLPATLLSCFGSLSPSGPSWLANFTIFYTSTHWVSVFIWSISSEVNHQPSVTPVSCHDCPIPSSTQREGHSSSSTSSKKLSPIS